jgi:transcriptional regulator with XRE-family HTH domain
VPFDQCRTAGSVTEVSRAKNLRAATGFALLVLIQEVIFMRKRYETYPQKASDDPKCVVVASDTRRIIGKMATWYDRCKALMKAQEITQEDLKSVFRVKTRGAVGHYLPGRRQPSAEQLFAVARRLGTTTEYLLTGAEPGQQSPAAAPPDLYGRSDDATRALVDLILESSNSGQLSPAVADALQRLVAALNPPAGYDRLRQEARPDDD